jgi:hypothetical protein
MKTEAELYRYSNGVYYARIKIDGKDIKRSLKTADRDFAKRALQHFGMSNSRLIARKES